MTFFRTLLLILAAALVALPARADEVAPDLEGSDLRQKAQLELRRLFVTLDKQEQRRLVGTYVVFDASASDPFAQVACDDDGDHVIVVSDAMLRLVAHVARALSYDEANNARRIDEYAAFLARSQVPGRRLLPPPPGFFAGDKPSRTYDVRFDEALAFVLAHELARLRSGDLVCPKPTATKESGDDDWSANEQRKASEIAKSVYPTNTKERDVEAMERVFNAGHEELGALGFLRFFIQLEIERAAAGGRFQPTYLVHHPGSAPRGLAVKSAAESRRAHE